MKTLVFEYDAPHTIVAGEKEILPMQVAMPICEENGFIVLRFTEESFSDITNIAKNHGLKVFIEEK